MKKKLTIALGVALGLILAVCLVVVIRQQLVYSQGEELKQEAIELVNLPELEALPLEETAGQEETDPNILRMAEIDLEPLQKINGDVMGWISIPGTEVNYPLVRGADNDYYLTHAWSTRWNSAGSIFQDVRSRADFSDFNTILYGHRMRNGSMFGSLKSYVEEEYWQAHPSVYIALADGVRRYDIYAAYEAELTTATYASEVTDPRVKERMIQHGLDNSEIDTGLTPDAGDTILTLSTCTGRGHRTRWVVQAVRVR